MSTKPKDWHSRRHRTDEAHRQARNAWREKLANKKASALARQEEANKRAPQEQLDRLNKLGLAAKKERAKLAKKLA